jgi:hypothetical protein
MEQAGLELPAQGVTYSQRCFSQCLPYYIASNSTKHYSSSTD